MDPPIFPNPKFELNRNIRMLSMKIFISEFNGQSIVHNKYFSDNLDGEPIIIKL